MIKKFKLGNSAFAYIRRQLSIGDVVSTMLLDLPLEAGETRVLLPSLVDPQRLSFEHGGLSRFNFDDDLRQPLIELVSDFLAESSLNIIVFEAPACRPDTKPGFTGEVSYFTHFPSAHWIHNPATGETAQAQAVLSYLTGKNFSSMNQVERLFEVAREYPTIGIMSSLSDCVSESSLGHSLRILVQRTNHILVGVYDEQTALVWSK